jgi:phosphoribosylformylglycinamidine synthase
MAGHIYLFAEDQARYLIAAQFDTAAEIYECAREAGVPAEPVGAAGGCEIAFGAEAIDLGELRQAWEAWLPALMAAPPAA